MQPRVGAPRIKRFAAKLMSQEDEDYLDSMSFLKPFLSLGDVHFQADGSDLRTTQLGTNSQ